MAGWQVCAGDGNPNFDARFAACTAIIDSPAPSGMTVAETYGNRAIAYQNNNDSIRAIAEYVRSLELDAASASAHTFAGNKFVLENNPDRAFAEFKAAVDLDPKYATAFNGLGLVHLRRKEPNQAILDFTDAIRLRPDYAGYYKNRGLAYQDINDLARSLADLDRAIDLAPQVGDYHYVRARLAYASKRYDLAAADLTSVIEFGRKNAFVYFLRGLAYHAQNETAAANADFKEALRIDPGLARSLVVRASAEVDSRNYTRAFETLREALILAPDEVGAYFTRGRAYRRKADYISAIADFDEALRRNPKYVDAYVERGLSYRERGDISKSIADYDHAIEIEPENVTARFERCLERIKAGTALKDAIADCDTALRVRPKMAAAFRVRGYGWLKLGSLKPAFADFDDALKLEPKDAWSLYGRALAKWETGDVRGAEADVAAANKLRAGLPAAVLKYLGVTANQNFSYRLARAYEDGSPMIFAIAEGGANACGPGCKAWIVADGNFDHGAAQRFRAFLGTHAGRKLPIVINSAGGSLADAFAMGKLMRARGMTIRIAATEPDGCAGDRKACREKLHAATPVTARLRVQRAICNSACVYALMGASHRQIPDGAVVGVHHPISPAPPKSTHASRARIDAREHAARRRYAQEMGVDPALVDLSDEVPYQTLHILSRDEIGRFKLQTAE
ncbi:MAG: tetratricopeptide repeat protein [Pseudolabrys sp.]